MKEKERKKIREAMTKKTKRLTPAEEGERAARQENAERMKDISFDDLQGVVQLFRDKVLIAVANGEIDLNKIARQTLSSRGLDTNGEWIGFSRSKRAENICPACNGEGEVISGKSYWTVYECHNCAALYSRNISHTEMRKYVLVDQWVEDESKVESEDQRHFDFRFVGVDNQVHRIHGWFDINSKKLLQLG